MTKEQIIAELNELDLSQEQFDRALERRLSQLVQRPAQPKQEPEDDGHCEGCVL